MKYKSIKIFINYFLGPVLFLWLAWSIYREIKRQEGLEAAWLSIKDSFSSILVLNIVLVILLMLVNWSLEAIKWKLAVRPVERVSFFRAFKAVISGISFSVSTPNRIGEYLGRILYIHEGNRLKTISVTIVSSMSQLIVTLLMGLAGLLVLRRMIEAGQLISAVWMNVVITGVFLVLTGLTLFYFRLSVVIRFINRVPGSGRFSYLVKALEEFDATMLLQLLSLSLARFCVFTLQYYLLFRFFNVDVSWWQSFWSVSVSFLVMAMIPTIAIVELVQRGKVVTSVIALFSVNLLGAGLATASIWLINLILPAVAGSLLILMNRRIFEKGT
jgi:hypothetical protein